jgi:AAA+ ATPase superfamily predicted ATPase
MFFNRDYELQQLERLYSSSRAEMFILYGRRRVGKTELLRAFCKDKQHIFFIATLSSDHDQLASFSHSIWVSLHPGLSDPNGTNKLSFPSWEAAFHALAELPGRPIVVMDEFTYLINGNKAVPSILQKVWDETLKNTRLFLILCGSYIGMMETEVLGYQAPLYGRRTGSLLLPPLNLQAASHFYPTYDPIQVLEAWAVVGGMPYYLQAFSGDQDVMANIRYQILDHLQGRLFNEPRLLLMEELREPRNYFSILRAIAQGKTRLNEITQEAGVGDVNTTGRYLDILQQMRLITRRVPVTESQPEKSKKGIYQVDDHFLRFWFRFVHPNLGSLDLGLEDAILEQKIRPGFDAYVAGAFEEAARAYVSHIARRGELGFIPERIGSWWNRDTEIDVVAINLSDNVFLLGECKWWNHPVGINVLNDLKHKGQNISQPGYPGKIIYSLFSRSGFTSDLIDLAERDNIFLVTPSDLTS